MKKIKKSFEILNAHLKKLQKENSKFSIRSLSLKLGVSHAFIVNVLNGKQLLPLKRIDKICEILKVDEFDKNEIKQKIYFEKNKLNETSPEILPLQKAQTDEDLLPESHFRILRYWWNLAILELLSCFKEQGLSKRELLQKIAVTEEELDISLNELLQLKLIKKSGAHFVKTNENLKLTTRGPHQITRQFYKSALTLASKALDQTDSAAFDKRLITTISCSVNPDQIPKAKKKLAEALAEIRDILTEGECSEVYFLQAQLFSVLR